MVPLQVTQATNGTSHFLGLEVDLATVPAHLGEDDALVTEVPTGRNTGSYVPPGMGTRERPHRFLVKKRTMALSGLVKWFMKTLT